MFKFKNKYTKRLLKVIPGVHTHTPGEQTHSQKMPPNIRKR